VHDPFEPYVGQMCEGITHSIYGTYTPFSFNLCNDSYMPL
jgi:hypothetical protein